ncbi:MAG: electron transport complex subunit RsxC [Candidatus Omnitrophica bacterium]|nr:electron transport complex subunit RsxC [Candidatus Omnitrophota bacterium]MCM8802272.1 electron transport complex subunit RsxC [Candidatus Omnitrophota bacterium]
MFKGGVKLLDFKSLSKDEEIKDFKEPDKVVIPLSQHTGAPAKPVVKKGDYVVKGQVIGEINGFISSYIHSSISGKVVDILPWNLPTNRKSLSIVIENDGQKKGIEKNQRNWLNLESSEIINIVRESGIVGLGGAAFPTHVKLTIPEGKKAEFIIINGCECEPFLTCDYRVLKEYTDEVIEGIQIICKATNVKKVFIGIEHNKIDLIPILNNAIKNLKIYLEIEIKILPEKYPQGSEKHLIKSILNREVPSGGLPIDVGCIVFNVQTTLAIKRAVCDGMPLTERILTCTGLVEKPNNLKVKIGTLISEILKFCEGKINSGRKIVIGGPMMGIQIPNPDVPVIKGTTGILLLPEEDIPEKIQPCIRCGKCLEVCPMFLAPSEIGRYVEFERFDKCENLNVFDCIECGCCSYICPAKRPLVDFIKYAKFKFKKK